jgi:BirA family biotin operon repressor/biotin-[acetyl-CoA-carboxylase] ligase
VTVYRKLGSPAHRFPSIASTMIEAQRLAQEGAAEGTLVLADTQTAGRGRLGRSWMSEPGRGLYFSLILRPRLPAPKLPLLTLALGLGVAEGIEKACKVECDLRWPNDVLLDGKKCCGILVETSSEPDGPSYLIAGVGINVNHPAMPPDLAEIATSLRIETGCEYDREDVLHAVLRGTERYYGIFLDDGPNQIVAALTEKSSYVFDKEVSVINGDSATFGTTAGLDPSGVLLLRLPDGRTVPVLAGSVRPVQAPGVRR